MSHSTASWLLCSSTIACLTAEIFIWRTFHQDQALTFPPNTNTQYLTSRITQTDQRGHWWDISVNWIHIALMQKFVSCSLIQFFKRSWSSWSTEFFNAVEHFIFVSFFLSGVKWIIYISKIKSLFKRIHHLLEAFPSSVTIKWWPETSLLILQLRVLDLLKLSKVFFFKAKGRCSRTLPFPWIFLISKKKLHGSASL